MRLIRGALGLADAQPPQSQLPVAPVAAPVPVLKPAMRMDVSIQPRPASFTEHVFMFGDEGYAYRLYLPAMAAPDSQSLSPLPLVVMLHGCKQDAADFAQGTGMNALAGEKDCIVLYPEQSSRANPMRCWNWFEPANQDKEAGEAAMIRSTDATGAPKPRRGPGPGLYRRALGGWGNGCDGGRAVPRAVFGSGGALGNPDRCRQQHSSGL